MKNQRPDRVPVRLFAEEFASKYAHVTNQDAACDYTVAFDATRKCARELNVDAAMCNGIVNWMGMSSMIGWKAVKFPGLGIPPNYVTQITEPDEEEKAYLKSGEYEEFSEEPTRFLCEKWLPRFSSHIHCTGEPVTFSHNMSLISGSIAYLQYMTAFGKYGELFKEAGIVIATMINYTLEHGVFNTSSAYSSSNKISGIKPSCYTFEPGNRPAGICIPWEEFKKDMPPMQGNIDIMKKAWQDVDSLGYSFLWSNLIW